MNTSSFTISLPMQVPPPCGFTAAKYSECHIFMCVTQQFLGLFKEALGAAPGMNMALFVREKSKYRK